MRDLTFVKNPADKKTFRLFSKIKDNWKELCYRLGLDDYISELERQDADERLRRIFGKWRDNAMNLEGDAEAYSYSWEGLRNLLEDADYGTVSDEYFAFLEKIPSKKL